jgi:hypothetical protein
VTEGDSWRFVVARIALRDRGALPLCGQMMADWIPRRYAEVSNLLLTRSTEGINVTGPTSLLARTNLSRIKGRLVALAHKRRSKIGLTKEEVAEEARRIARVDTLIYGAEGEARSLGQPPSKRRA